jgi:very-short-patch-repair endonuclease
VRLPARAEHTLLERCAAYSALMPPWAFFSHRTAGRIHGVPLPGREVDELLHVCVYKPERAPRAEGIAGHHATLGTTDTVTRFGWSVTSPAHTLRQLAAELSLDQLVVVGDALVARARPLCTLQQLADLLPAAEGMRGAVTLREALRLIRVGSESPMETRLRLLLVRGGLPEPALNVDIRDRRGRFVARGDLVYEKERVVVEYDGDQHRSERAQYERDVDRLEQLGDEGWRVIRVLHHHMAAPHAVVARVRAALAGR